MTLVCIGCSKPKVVFLHADSGPLCRFCVESARSRHEVIVLASGERVRRTLKESPKKAGALTQPARIGSVA